MASIKKKILAKSAAKPAPKPVMVTIAKIAACEPCWWEFAKFLRRVGGRPPQSYVDMEVGRCGHGNSGCHMCVRLQLAAKKAAKIKDNTPIALADIYKMKREWGTWVFWRVLSLTDQNRFNRFNRLTREALEKLGRSQ